MDFPTPPIPPYGSEYSESYLNDLLANFMENYGYETNPYDYGYNGYDGYGGGDGGGMYGFATPPGDYVPFLNTQDPKDTDLITSQPNALHASNHTEQPMDDFGLLSVSGYLNFGFTLPASLILSIFGAATNIINLVVFRRLGYLIDSCTPILVGRAVSDFWYCLITFITSLLQMPAAFAFYAGKGDDHESQTLDSVVERIASSLAVFAQFTCWATTFLAFERMISIVFPIQVKAFFTPKRSSVIIGVIFVCSFILNVHRMIFFKLVRKEIVQGSGKQYLHATKTGLISTDLYNRANFVNNIVLRLASLLLVFLLNVIIVVQIRCRKRRTKSSAKSGNVSGNIRFEIPTSRKETKLTRLILAVCSMFLVCYPLGVVYNIATTFDDAVSAYSLSVYDLIISKIFPVLELINSSLNFVIYKAFSSKFDTELRRLWSSPESNN